MKHSMNAWPMRRRFSCGSVTPASAVRNWSSAFTTCRSVLKCFVNSSMTDCCFVLAQQAVVDQDARELRADRLVQQRRDDRRIDAARQAADHAVVADALANRRESSARRNRPAARCRGSRRRS